MGNSGSADAWICSKLGGVYESVILKASISVFLIIELTTNDYKITQRNYLLIKNIEEPILSTSIIIFIFL